MKTKQKTRRALITDEDAMFQSLYDIREGITSVAARDYMDRYIRLKAKALRLEKWGLKVRIVLPDFPHRPMLVIGKGRR
jgi:hypothetical protein